MSIASFISADYLAAAGNIITACVAVFTITIYVKHTRYLLRQTMIADEQLKILSIRLEDDRLSRQMEFHSAFQKKLREIQVRINYLAAKEDECPPHELDILLNEYWSLVFDEWFICHNGGEDLKVLWKKY